MRTHRIVVLLGLLLLAGSLRAQQYSRETQLAYDPVTGLFHMQANGVDTIVNQGGGGAGNPGGSNTQLQYNNSGTFGGFTLGGDCAITVPNITCTKTSGIPFAPSAITDATNATNISSGTLNAGRLPTSVPTSIVNDTNITGSISSNVLTLAWSGTLAVSRGGIGTGTLSGIAKGNGTSPFTTAASGDVIGLWTGTCNSSTFLRGDGSCITPSGSGTVNAANQYSVAYYPNSGSASVVGGLAPPTGPNGVPEFVLETPSGGAAVAPVFALSGTPIDAQTGTTYTISATCTPAPCIQDRSGLVSTSNVSAIAVTVPQAGAGNFANNFTFALANINTGLVTMTPTTSTVNGNASQIVPNHWVSFWYSDNTNYRALTTPDFAAFPSCTSGALGFTTATGVFPCNTFATLAPSPVRAGDVIYWNGSSWVTLAGNNSGTNFLQESSSGVPSWAAGSSAVALSAITAATTTNSIASGNNAQTWQWALTGATTVAITLGESAASTGGTAKQQALLQIDTSSGSTATPLIVNNSLTGSQALPALYVNPTWNTTGVVDAAILVNATNTASGTGSLLLDLQIGGSSEFNIDKAGHIVAASLSTAHGVLLGEGATAAIAETGAGGVGQILRSAGAGTDPAYSDFPDFKDVPAANCNNSTAGAAWSVGSGGTVTCRAGTNDLGGYISISDTSSTFATFQIAIPADWDSGTNPYIRVQLASTDATNAHTIIPEINVACYKGDGSTTDDVAPNGFHSLSTVTLNGNANRFWSTSNVQMNSTDMTGCVAGGLMQITIGRATDTATNAEFYSATVTFPRVITVQAN